MNPAAEQFHKRAADFVRANPDMVCVVRGDEKREIVRAWFTYFHSRGQTGTIDLFYRLLAGNGVVQFPCDAPEHFDPSYEPLSYQWSEPDTGPVSRGDVSQVVAQTMNSLRAAKPKGRQPVPRNHLKPPEKTPQEWLNEYAANPPPVPVFSDEFKAKLQRDRGVA